MSSDDLFQFCYFDNQYVGSRDVLRSAALRSVGNMRRLDSMFFMQDEMTEFSTQADLAQITSIESTWDTCRKLTSFPFIDTSSVADMYHTWNHCSSLTSFPLIDTSSVTDMAHAWAYCSNLSCIPRIDTRVATDKEDMFSGDTALVHPNASEQAALMAEDGALYEYDGPCP